MFESLAPEAAGSSLRMGRADVRLASALARAPVLLEEARLLRLRPLDPRVELARIAGLPPTPLTLAALDALDVQSLLAHDQVTWLGLWERHRGWFDGRAQAGIVSVGGGCPPPSRLQPDSDRDDVGREQVALALRLSSATGGARLDVARELTGRLARTLTALGRGELTYWHAKAVADAVAPFDDAAALAVERTALDGAPAFETLTSFRKRVARAVIAANPQTADEQHLAAVVDRRVIMWAEPHGMATVAATLTADEAATAMRALTALAHRSRAQGDDQPVDMLRADAFSRLFDAALAHPDLPSEQRTRPRVGITIDAATLLGLADHPGHLDGYGPIPPVMARRLAAGGDWHRLVTDPVTGALLDYGRTSYRPPDELVEYLTARDRTCRHPTCARPARLCDIDHAQPYDLTGGGEGGSTSSANCGAACRRNHGQKTVGDLLLVSHPDGSATWTTNAGHTYHRPAIDHCPEHTAYLREQREHAADAERDGEQADGRWEDPDWFRAHADDHGWTTSDGTGDGTSGPAEDDPTAQVHSAEGSAATTHDAAAEEASRDDVSSDTSSGNDPPGV